jgi:chromosome segregation ATPase
MHAVVVTVATTILVGSIVPAAMAADPAPPDMEAAVPEIRQGETDKLVIELRSRIDELSAVNTELSDENSALHDENEQLSDERDHLQQEVDTLTRDRDRLASGLTVFDDLYDPLEADRKLLLDLRKPVEDMTRTEAEQHVKRIQDLAQASNPSSLGRLADQLGESAPAFLDWRETQYASTEEATLAFIDSGASEFTSTMEDFTNEFLLSVASRLDGLLTILDSVR